MSNHNEEKEAIEAALERAANYRGIALCTPSVTRVGDWLLNADGTITGANYTVDCPPSAQVKALIDASLDAESPSVDVPPIDPIEPPIDTPPADVPPDNSAPVVTGMTLTTVSGESVFNIGDTINFKAYFNVSDGSTKPCSYKMQSLGGVVTFASMWTPVGVAAKSGRTKVQCDNGGFVGIYNIVVRNADGSLPPETPVTPPKDTTPNNPSNPTTNPSLPPIPPSNGAASHTVIAIVVDGGGIEWKAEGTVGNDATVAGQLANLKNADGVDHGGLQAMFYADCCHVAIQRFDAQYSECGCSLTVTYDGQPAAVPPSSFEDGTYTFWRGSWMPAIRYGDQVPFDAAKIDWSVLPNFAKEKQQHLNLANYDFTFNGLGVASYTGMGTTGERGDIGFLATVYMAFITDPCEETWAAVRKAEDWSGNWSMTHVSDPITGKIVKNTDFPNVSLMSPIQAKWAGNPVAVYLGMRKGAEILPKTNGWDVSGCPNNADIQHLTSYGMIGAMITGSARDLDNASFWANFVMIKENPYYFRSGSVVTLAPRGFAWGLRTIFISSFYSSDTDYFRDEVLRILSIADAQPKNEFGILNTDAPYIGEDEANVATGYKGVALWMQSYLAIVYGAVAQKFPEAVAFAQFLGKLEVTWFSKPYYFQRTIYSFICRNPDKTLMTDFDQMVKMSLVTNGYTEAEAEATVNSTTVEEAFAIHTAYQNRQSNQAFNRPKLVNGVADFRSGFSDPDSYPAGAIASVYSAANVGTPGIEQAVSIIENLPTKINYSKNQQNHIIEKE